MLKILYYSKTPHTDKICSLNLENSVLCLRYLLYEDLSHFLYSMAFTLLTWQTSSSYYRLSG